ncbi:MAG: hypothetical protein II989_04100 [Bacteroidales bacterium]|nr:hypothetical protein [Bacteroidales bacterium]MBQ3613254.1 hypothetical protein [Bacteroidales bacterium]
MVSFIIWLVGAICCIWCIKDVWTKNLDTVIKILLTIGLLVCSWIGLAIYYFLLRNRL